MSAYSRQREQRTFSSINLFSMHFFANLNLCIDCKLHRRIGKKCSPGYTLRVLSKTTSLGPFQQPTSYVFVKKSISILDPDNNIKLTSDRPQGLKSLENYCNPIKQLSPGSWSLLDHLTNWATVKKNAHPIALNTSIGITSKL